jgi:hypothetical protein
MLLTILQIASACILVNKFLKISYLDLVIISSFKIYFMAYSVNLLTTVADCDSVILVAEKEKSDLNFRRASAERQKDTYASNSISIDADIAATNAEIAALAPVVASLLAGAAKDDNETRLKKLELKKFLLAQKTKTMAV